ncbi:hypothetical protein JCM10212_001322 [Sporobolomyces blumeae]
MDRSLSPVSASTPAPSSPATKTVSFASTPLPPANSLPTSSTATLAENGELSMGSTSASTSATPSSTQSSSSAVTRGSFPEKPTPKRRRSSIKQGVQMPYKPPKEYYTHSDPLLRRLRLRNGFGTMVNLEQEFRDTKVVLFFFAATWRGSSSDPFEAVQTFQRRFPHQCKVVYVSVDDTLQAYEQNTRQKPWLSMEWNDGSNLPSASPDSAELPPPLEPYLLAGDPDLEEDLSHSDSTGSVYLRPYSRVHLADKWTVLGVPNLVVYHVGKREVLSYHARFELLREGKMIATWDRWSKGEKVTFGVHELVYALRHTILIGVIALVYLSLVRSGRMPNYVQEWSQGFAKGWMDKGVGGPGSLEL